MPTSDNVVLRLSNSIASLEARSARAEEDRKTQTETLAKILQELYRVKELNNTLTRIEMMITQHDAEDNNIHRVINDKIAYLEKEVDRMQLLKKNNLWWVGTVASIASLAISALVHYLWH